jgi:hypothetical protein
LCYHILNNDAGFRFKLSIQILGDSVVVSIELKLSEIERSLEKKGYKPDGLVDIYLIRPNYLNMVGEIVVAPQEELPNPNNYASIYGYVTDTNGNPVPDGTMVKLSPYVEPAFTKDGYYRFLNNIPVYDQSTEYTITVESLQFYLPEPKTIPVSPDDVWEVNIILKPYNPLESLGSIINSVKDAVSGNPLGDVSVKSYDSNTKRLSDYKKTSPDGTCQLNSPSGTYDLIFSKDGYYLKELNNVSINSNQSISKEILLEKISVYSPVISSVTATPLFTAVGGSSTIKCNAYDPDGDPLTYSWTYAGGSISGSAANPIVTWIAPSTAGTYAVTCKVLDSIGKSDSRNVNIDVSASTTPLSITSTFLPSGKVGFAYAVNLSGTGGKTPYSWSIVNGTLPPGLSLSTSGMISGTPATTGEYNFTIQLSDSGSPQQTVSIPLSITVINPPTTVDTNPPSTPTNLVATAVSSSQIDLSWAASIDNVGVSGYRIYRNGTFIKPVITTSTSDTGLNSSTNYCYTVSAYDAAGNESPQSGSVCATTTSIAQNLSVSSFTATPSSGPAPLNGVDLTASVGGTATGTINYTFYCNRSDTGTNITSGWAAKYDGVTTNPMTALDACNYSTPGTYTAKVIVERGTQATEARTTITVNSSTFSIGDRVQTTSNLNVRTCASLSCTTIATEPTGAKGTIIGGPQNADGYTWWQIRYDDGITGWSVQNWLQKI